MSLPSPMSAVFSACSPAGRRGRLSILIFHRVLPSRDPLFPAEVDVTQFERILTWLKQCFNVLPLDDAARALKHGALPARAAAITFDDGYADNCTNALPLLQRHSLPATFFIATGFLDGGRMWNDTLIESIRSANDELVELDAYGIDALPIRSIEEKRRAIKTIIPALKHLPGEERDEAVAAVAAQCKAPLPDDLMLTTAQLKALHAAGMSIGAHTVSHPILARCSEDEARREIDDSRAHLENVLDERVSLFAYPNGKLGEDYTGAHAKLVAELGFEAAVSTNPGASRHGDDIFQLRRFTPWDKSRSRFLLRLAHNIVRGAKHDQSAA